MKKPTPNLTHLLNKVEAMLAAKAGTMAELVGFLKGSTQPQVHNWVIGRKNVPGGEVTLQLAAWVQLKEREIELGNMEKISPLEKAFVAEFKRVSKEHPAEL